MRRRYRAKPKATLSRQLEAVAHPLTGNFALIRLAKRSQKASWLLIKMQDKEVRPDPV